MEFNVTYSIGPNEYIDAQLTHNKYSTTVKAGINKTRISLFCFYTFVALLLYHALNDSIRTLVTVVIAVLGITHIVLVSELYKKRIQILSKRIIQQTINEEGSDKKKLRIHGNEIEYIEKKRKTTIDIEKLDNVLESVKNYFIFWDENNAIILPKRIEGDENTPVEIIKYIKGINENV